MSADVGCAFVLARTRTRVITCGVCSWCVEQHERELAAALTALLVES